MSVLGQMPSVIKIVIKLDFCTFHIDKSPTQEPSHPCTTATLLRNTSVVKFFASRKVLSAQELFAIASEAGDMWKSRCFSSLHSCPCRITDQRLGCHHAILFSRQCSQKSAGVYSVALPQVKNRQRRTSGGACGAHGCWSGLARRRGRVSGGRYMFEKMGKAWVRRLKACVAAKGVFLNSDPATSHRTAQRHSAKRRHQHLI